MAAEQLSVHLAQLLPRLQEKIPANQARVVPRAVVADMAREVILHQATTQNMNLLDQRDLVTALVNGLLNGSPAASAAMPAPPPPPPAAKDLNGLLPKEQRASVVNPLIDSVKDQLQPLVLERIDVSVAAKMSREQLSHELTPLCDDLLREKKMTLNGSERQELVSRMLDDMLGLGPLEPLLRDETISEIMVNGPKQIYIEQKGKLQLSDVTFRDNAHAQAIATRIVTAIGRRIDESSPLCDARLADGSRVNIIIPPLAIDGAAITIRKFSKKKITLDKMIEFGSMSVQMATILRIAARSRCNIIISGGTGSGKTTLLNALSQMIDHGERVVTIEDAAELQLQQPHVVRLERRPANLEGDGEITIRDLLKNALRMRPDRIIVGECRGGEAIDMLQAMNTGHDGSMSTVHANRPREALMRLENMVGLGGANLAPRAVRTQVASAVDMIVQVSRMRDGGRRITYISEIVGMEGEVVTMQDLFTTDVVGELPNGKLKVDFKYHNVRPAFLPKAQYYGLERQLMETLGQ